MSSPPSSSLSLLKPFAHTSSSSALPERQATVPVLFRSALRPALRPPQPLFRTFLPFLSVDRTTPRRPAQSGDTCLTSLPSILPSSHFVGYLKVICFRKHPFGLPKTSSGYHFLFLYYSFFLFLINILSLSLSLSLRIRSFASPRLVSPSLSPSTHPRASERDRATPSRNHTGTDHLPGPARARAARLYAVGKPRART